MVWKLRHYNEQLLHLHHTEGNAEVNGIYNLLAHHSLNSVKFHFKHQHGFREGLSCLTELAEFTHDLHETVNLNYQNDAIYLGFSKAFD